jgi:transketolase
MAQYAILNARGQISDEDLFSVSQAHGKLGGHPDLHIDGVSASTGSLGHGLGIALGMAVAWKERGKESTVSVVMSDGELMEGSSWESLLLAPTLHLSQVTVVIDHNKSISRGKIPDLHPNLMPLAIKIEAFGWAVYEVDGHDTAAIVEAWNSANKDPRPCAIVAHTIKGKGVSFMEDIPLWAYRSPNKMEFRQAMQELGGEN